MTPEGPGGAPPAPHTVGTPASRPPPVAGCPSPPPAPVAPRTGLQHRATVPDLRNAADIAREPLRALIAHDEHHRAPLLETARAFVETGGHYGRAAERCYVAVSTLKYRIRKIEELLGKHPADPELALRLALAFKVQDLLAVTDLHNPKRRRDA